MINYNDWFIKFNDIVTWLFVSVNQFPMCNHVVLLGFFVVDEKIYV